VGDDSSSTEQLMQQILETWDQKPLMMQLQHQQQLVVVVLRGGADSAGDGGDGYATGGRVGYAEGGTTTYLTPTEFFETSDTRKEWAKILDELDEIVYSGQYANPEKAYRDKKTNYMQSGIY
jgi:hypothetical protein